MKTIFKCPNHFWFALALCAMIFSGCSCSDPKPTPDPLAGFHFSSLVNFHSNKTITDDCQDYIQKLPPEEKKFVGPINFFENESGQHAVQIEIALNGTMWNHVLFYDKDNKRIKVIKYVGYHYSS